MSESRFMRFFKHATGQSFVSYLNGVRIAKAQALLASTDQSVAQVSHEVGFCDQSYFGLVFRTHAKMSPLEYRHRVQLETPQSSP
jgi:two-component system response regulator YesN